MLQDRLQLPNHDIFLVSSATCRILFSLFNSRRKRKISGECVEPSHTHCLYPDFTFAYQRANPSVEFQERPPDKDKVQPHLLQQAITDMITQVEDIGQVSSVDPLVVRCVMQIRV